MTKVSASTLIRRAAKTKDKAAAKRLRAEAAKRRRDRRVADAAGLAITEAQRKPRPMKGLGEQTINRALASVDHTPLTAMVNQEQPGHGEIVGGYLSHRAEEIAKLARKKGGTDAIQAHLRAMQITARAEAMDDANQRARKVAQEANEQWRENIVTGFMARMAGLERMHRNGLPEAVVVDGVTLARVCDALAAAGYTASGKKH